MFKNESIDMTTLFQWSSLDQQWFLNKQIFKLVHSLTQNDGNNMVVISHCSEQFEIILFHCHYEGHDKQLITYLEE